MKTYALGVSRFVQIDVDNSTVIIKDSQSSAEATFPKVRWASFLGYLEEIDAEVKKLKEEKTEFRYCQSYGGGWQVSVTMGFPCVDFRRFFLNDKNEIKPTRQGIALRLHEWETLKGVIERIRSDIPEFGTMRACCHEIMDDWLECRECFPFIRR